MQEYIDLLKNLISTPSFSRQEDGAAEIMRNFLQKKQVPFHIKSNNTWAFCRHFIHGKPTILLNSHIDTVKPASGWNYDPFTATEEDGRITGLGSNDAGGPLVSLLAAFIHFYHREDLNYNLIFAATAEEEISGPGGFASIIPGLPEIKLAIVGEPTRMDMAIAEKGLMVLDCVAIGKAGHAARNEGINALYLAMDDIQKLQNYSFDAVSEVLGPVKTTVTQINAGTQHNVVPDTCSFVVDVRTNEFYSNKEAFEIIDKLLTSEVKPRSLNLNSSGIPKNHPFAQKAKSIGLELFGSPTTSDQAVMPWPSVKIGPGDSARSHTANEYILKSEIENGIKTYIALLEDFSF